MSLTAGPGGRRYRVLRSAAVLVGVLIIAAAAFVVADRGGTSPQDAVDSKPTVYYVSPSGSDSDRGTAPDAPWGTVAYGLATLAPGDTLYLRGGRYVENITTTAIRPATPSAPILVAGYPGEQPIIEGLLWLKNASWWTIDRISVTWNAGNPSTRHMVKITDGVGWTVTNSEFWGARSYAALLVAGTVPGQPADWTISGNCVHDTARSNDVNQDHLIYVNTGLGAGRGTIQRNVLFNAINGMGVKLGGSDVTGGSTNVAVTKNTIHNTSQSVLVAGDSHDNSIVGNIFSAAGTGYSSVRGYQLNGAGNSMRDNLGHGARSILLNDAGYPGVVNAGGNLFPVNPRFDDTGGCGGFRPLNPEATGFGHLQNGPP